MIKGWKLNPGWRNYYESRKFSELQCKQLQSAIDAQQAMVRIQQEHADRSRKHMEECHASKQPVEQFHGELKRFN